MFYISARLTLPEQSEGSTSRPSVLRQFLRPQILRKSLQDNWPLAHDVHPYLHGLNDPEPEAYVAWRAELNELPSSNDSEPDIAAKVMLAMMRAALRYYRLRPLELLREKPQRIAELLLALRQRNPLAWVVRIHQRSVSVQRLNSLPNHIQQLARQLHYETVIIPPSVGGLDDAGMLELPDSKAEMVASVRDVADLALSDDGKQFVVARRRVLLTRDDEGRCWHYQIVAADSSHTDSSGSEPSETYPRWTSARDRAARSLGMKYVARVVLAEDDDGPSRMLLFFRKVKRPQTRADGQRIAIGVHNENVRQIAGRVTGALNLEPMLKQAFDVAAGRHDSGKADLRWQTAIGNDDMDNPLAKSFGEGFNIETLNGYRHEFGSLRGTVSQLPDDEARDLALHLVASHHGRGRPHFDPLAMADPTGLPDELPPLLQPAETARRFARLQRRFGHWGLAWLESILMAADGAASAAAGALADDEVEEEEA